MRSRYREKYYVCGDYLELNVYPVYKTARYRRRKAKATSECQQKVNQMNAENKCIRLAHANFNQEDMKVDLTYDNGHLPGDDEAAARELANFFRRVKRYRASKELPELKYIAVTEKGKRTGRYHHHLIISGGLSPQEIISLWGKGYVRTDGLQFNENGIADLVKYILKKSVASGKRWNASKNLIHPEPKQRDGRLSKRAVQELAKDPENNREYERYYDGYYLAEARRVYNDINGGVYIYARFYKKEAEFCREKKRSRSRCSNGQSLQR
ncbi:MAG: hypothetical protein GXY08_01665 [Ruminococcus sp.]|nr:hypothetical protein [Ruminococcus sp.]